MMFEEMLTTKEIEELLDKCMEASDMQETETVDNEFDEDEIAYLISLGESSLIFD